MLDEFVERHITNDNEKHPLTNDNVEKIFVDCLAPNKDTEGAVLIEGVRTKAMFMPDKITEHKAEIIGMLSKFDPTFMQDQGGGWSFLNMCVDKNGHQWTDFHLTCDKLICLGLASGTVKFLIEDRKLWKIFPGSMPYIVVDFNQDEPSNTTENDAGRNQTEEKEPQPRI